MKKTTGKLYKNEIKWALIFIAIPLLGFLIFTVLPMGFSFWYSLTDYNPIRQETKFVLFENYKDLFQDKYFIQSIFNTIILLASIFVGMIFGLLLGTSLKDATKGNKLLRVIYYLPAVTSVVAVNIVWKYLFNGEYGLINYIFNIDTAWLGTGYFPIKLAIIIKNVWAGMGVSMILYIAGLNNIPETFYEAASMDGATKLQKFFRITVPLIRPITFYIIVTGIIGGLQSFADSQLLASGNPQATTIVYYIWSKGIDANKYGVAAAASLILGGIIMIITIIQFKKMDIVQD
jgi:multiple sugar transport system permease protein